MNCCESPTTQRAIHGGSHHGRRKTAGPNGLPAAVRGPIGLQRMAFPTAVSTRGASCLSRGANQGRARGLAAAYGAMRVHAGLLWDWGWQSAAIRLSRRWCVPRSRGCRGRPAPPAASRDHDHHLWNGYLPMNRRIVCGSPISPRIQGLRGQGVSRGRARHLLPACGRLVDRFKSDHRRPLISRGAQPFEWRLGDWHRSDQLLSNLHLLRTVKALD